MIAHLTTLVAALGLLAGTDALFYKIHPDGDTRYCLSLAGVSSGHPDDAWAEINECGPSLQEKWDVKPNERTQFRGANSEYCLAPRTGEQHLGTDKGGPKWRSGGRS